MVVLVVVKPQRELKVQQVPVVQRAQPVQSVQRVNVSVSVLVRRRPFQRHQRLLPLPRRPLPRRPPPPRRLKITPWSKFIYTFIETRGVYPVSINEAYYTQL
jgi:hypothetical protein